MHEQQKLEWPSLSNNFNFRSATPEDCDTLFNVCRRCFPAYFRWQSFIPTGKRWWRTVLQSQAALIYVLEDSEGVFAFNVLVIDFKAWNAEKQKREGSEFYRFASMLLCPVPSEWGRLFSLARTRLKRSQKTTPAAKDTVKRAAWSELTAVLPRMRRQGWAQWIITARENLAREHGATHIETHIASENIPSRRMNEKMGYRLVFEDSRGCLYRKTLTDDAPQGG